METTREVKNILCTECSIFFIQYVRLVYLYSTFQDASPFAFELGN